MNQQWTFPWLYPSNMPFDANQQYYYFIPVTQGLGTYQDVPQQQAQPMQGALPSEERAEVQSPEPTSSTSRGAAKREIPGTIQIPQQENSPQNSDRRETRLNQEAISKYAKKNVQSNIVNQVFSFLCIRSKSGKLVELILKNDQTRISKYYQLLRAVKKLNKKYINRIYLYNLLQVDRSHPIWKVISKSDYDNILSLDLLKKCLRVCTLNYLEDVCINTVFTSGKLERITKREHLKRRREVLAFIYEQYGRRICSN